MDERLLTLLSLSFRGLLSERVRSARQQTQKSTVRTFDDITPTIIAKPLTTEAQTMSGANQPSSVERVPLTRNPQTQRLVQSLQSTTSTSTSTPAQRVPPTIDSCCNEVCAFAVCTSIFAVLSLTFIVAFFRLRDYCGEDNSADSAQPQPSSCEWVIRICNIGMLVCTPMLMCGILCSAMSWHDQEEWRLGRAQQARV
jgi:hypothetical protein